MKIRTYRNYDYATDSTKIVIPEETLTEPGQDITPKQMLQRLTNGRPINASPGFFEFKNSDETFLIAPMKDMQWLDKLEQAHYLRSIKREIERLKKEINPDATKSIENTIEDKATKLETEFNNSDETP